MGIFDWSNKGNNEGLKAASRDDGKGNWWTRSDGSRGTSSTKENSDGTVTYHQKDYSAGSSRGTSSSQTYTKSGEQVSGPTSRSVK